MDSVWMLIIVSMLARPVIDGGPERVGDVVQSKAFGYAETEEKCYEGGNALTDVFDTAGGGSVINAPVCIEVSSTLAEEIADAQEFQSQHIEETKSDG
jgi:hypothetical protein